MQYFKRADLLIYLIYFIADIFISLFCYLTNPIIVLFADEYGNLPKIFKLWQTYDNCLDVGWMISEGHVPKFARYNFNEYYIYHLEDKSHIPIKPGYVEIVKPITSFKVKVQRYICRLCWLYRNCAYGWCYYILGKDIDCSKIVEDIMVFRDNKHYLYIKHVKDSYLFTIKACWDYSIPFTSKGLQVNIYLGWKFAGYNNKSESPQHAMLAIRVNPVKSQSSN